MIFGLINNSSSSITSLNNFCNCIATQAMSNQHSCIKHLVSPLGFLCKNSFERQGAWDFDDMDEMDLTSGTFSHLTTEINQVGIEIFAPDYNSYVSNSTFSQ